MHFFIIVSFIDTDELMDSQVQLSRLALHAQNHYLVMYDLGVTICSLAQSKGGRLIERMTVEIKKDKAEMVPQLRSGIIWQIKPRQGICCYR